MKGLIARVGAKADALSIPLNAHLDLTWRCNERCGHCYLEHRADGEMTTAEIVDALDQLAEAGTLFLTLSGGEIMLRRDVFEIVSSARERMFDVRLKTNGTLIGESEARRFADLGVREVHISVYSHRPEVHDSATGMPGSLDRSLEAARHLSRFGVAVALRCLIMQSNSDDYPEIQELAREVGAQARFDVQVTPRMDGGWEPVEKYQAAPATVERVFRDSAVVTDPEGFCAPPPPMNQDAMDGFPCSAGHSSCYVSPQGDVMPCVQFPWNCGSLRRARFAEIWRNSLEMMKVREVRNRDVAICNSCSIFSSCTRCPGLAFQEGDFAGPSQLECGKAYGRTGIRSLWSLGEAAPVTT